MSPPLPRMQSALNEPEVAFALPDAYVKPSLELIHGATTRLDELCNTILNFVRCNCVKDEPIQLPSRGGGKKDAVVRQPVEGKPEPASSNSRNRLLCLTCQRTRRCAYKPARDESHSFEHCRPGIQRCQQAICGGGGGKQANSCDVRHDSGLHKSHKVIRQVLAQFRVPSAIPRHQGHDVRLACASRAPVGARHPRQAPTTHRPTTEENRETA